MRNPRVLALVALAFTLIRHRGLLRARLQSLISSLRRAVNALRFASLVVSNVSSDAITYLAPLPRRARQQRRRVVHPPAPPSIRRLLRLAASEDGLAVLHNVAGGAARGIARELSASTRYVEARQEGISIASLIDSLASANGQKVVGNVVSTAVREAVSCAMQFQHRHRANDADEWPKLIIDAALSERGRKLAVDLATNVTRTVVPIVMANCKQEVPRVPSMRTLSPVASPLSKRPPSYRGCESPVTRQLVMSVMQAQGRSGLIERLALLAIRDKVLVKEVVRVVVTEGVRTYLMTSADIKERGEGGEKEEDGVPKSLWKVLIRSAVVDLKKAMLKRAEQGSTGWLVF